MIVFLVDGADVATTVLEVTGILEWMGVVRCGVVTVVWVVLAAAGDDKEGEVAGGLGCGVMGCDMDVDVCLIGGVNFGTIVAGRTPCDGESRIGAEPFWIGFLIAGCLFLFGSVLEMGCSKPPGGFSICIALLTTGEDRIGGLKPEGPGELRG
jgi:hypothetical protein